MSALEGSFTKRTVFSGALDLKLFEDGHVITVWPPHLLVEHLDDHLVGDAPVPDHGHLVTKVLTTQRTQEGRILRQIASKSLHKMFVRGVSHQNLRIGAGDVTPLDGTGDMNIFTLFARMSR